MSTNLILFDDANRIDLLPLVFTRPVAELRLGIMTIREKWEYELGSSSSTLTEPYLSEKFPVRTEKENLLINAAILPNPALIKQIRELSAGQALTCKERIIAQVISQEDLGDGDAKHDPAEIISFQGDLDVVRYPWDLFSMNSKEIELDFTRLTKEKKSAPLDPSSSQTGKHPIFIEEGASVLHSTLNTNDGPIYIGKNAEVMEGSHLRGPFALCEYASVKMGAKIYGATTIGPHSKVGGELNNVVIQGYSNKGHDGFLGNSVIGEWCNIGADTNTSNLKNTYDTVKMWSYREGRFIDSGLQFCGLIMGDHSKCGINTMFNTGTVVGVSCNIYGGGFQRNFIPSFSWGGVSGFQLYDHKKSMHVANAVMTRRGMMFDEKEQAVFKHLHELSKDKVRR